jgi:hypothetical protein
MGNGARATSWHRAVHRASAAARGQRYGQLNASFARDAPNPATLPPPIT